MLVFERQKREGCWFFKGKDLVLFKKYFFFFFSTEIVKSIINNKCAKKKNCDLGLRLYLACVYSYGSTWYFFLFFFFTIDFSENFFQSFLYLFHSSFIWTIRYTQWRVNHQWHSRSIIFTALTIKQNQLLFSFLDLNWRGVWYLFYHAQNTKI